MEGLFLVPGGWGVGMLCGVSRGVPAMPEGHGRWHRMGEGLARGQGGGGKTVQRIGQCPVLLLRLQGEVQVEVLFHVIHCVNLCSPSKKHFIVLKCSWDLSVCV